jgi:hypothetical protein
VRAERAERAERALCLTLALLPAAVGAQAVRGTVSAEGVRVPGALVLLVDSAGRTVARAASRENGAYAVAAPAAGAFTLRVLRIGFAPTTAGPLALRAGATLTRDVTLTGRPVRLTEVRVSDRATCRVQTDSSAAAFRVWEEARKALLGEALTRREPLTMRVTTSERALDAAGARVVHDTSVTRTVASVRPFVSRAADSLAAAGYVARDVAGGWIFWAPDAEVLLSESFATTHCFRAEAPSADSARLAGLVGVAFAPARARPDVAEVEGVLWLDRATAELRELAYRYVNLPADAPRAPSRGEALAGGRVEFLRLPTGGWIVHRWVIRLPVVAATSGRTVQAVVPGVQRERGPATVLVGVRHVGGEVSEVRRADAVLWERGRVAVRVRVVEAERGAPVPGAVVELDSLSALTADDGVATLLRVPPGAHVVGVRTPALTLLRAAPAPRAVTVADESAPLVIAVPSERAALERACGERAADWDEALVRGDVAAGVPNAAESVEATWRAAYVRLGGGAPVVVTERREAPVDGRGEFALCGVPRETDVEVRARRGAAAGRSLVVRVPAAAPGQAVRLAAPER